MIEVVPECIPDPDELQKASIEQLRPLAEMAIQLATFTPDLKPNLITRFNEHAWNVDLHLGWYLSYRDQVAHDGVYTVGLGRKMRINDRAELAARTKEDGVMFTEEPDMHMTGSPITLLALANEQDGLPVTRQIEHQLYYDPKEDTVTQALGVAYYPLHKKPDAPETPFALSARPVQEMAMSVSEARAWHMKLDAFHDYVEAP